MMLKPFLVGTAIAVAIGCREQDAHKKVFQAPASLQLGLGKVYEGYLIVQGGLASGNPVLSQNALSMMHGSLHEISTDGLDSSGKAYWDSGDGRIMEVLHNPDLATGGLPAVRKAIMQFSPLLLDRMESFGIMAQDPMFLFQCPEAGADTGAIWFQRDRKASNPYQGDSLRACGVVVREIGIPR